MPTTSDQRQASSSPRPHDPRSTPTPIEVIAHRGWSFTQPESTRAAYLATVDLAERTGRALQLECDVHFCASGELAILHDATLERTAGRPETLHELSLTTLRGIDFGSWKLPDPDDDQRAVMTLVELLDLVTQARERGVDVGLAIETKHPNPEGLAVDQQVLTLLREYGLDDADAPVRIITFDLGACQFWVERAPHLRRTLLVERELGPWQEGALPHHVDTMGIDLNLLRTDPGIAERLRERGHHLHVWTVNEADDVDWVVGLGAIGITTDRPDLVLDLTG